jgi:hypothetical protein
MPINVSEALDADTAEVVTVERTAGGTYVNGLYVPGAVSSFKMVASVQQPTMQQLQRLPENQRLLDTRMFYCNKVVFTANDRTNGVADHILYKGNRYTVLAVGDWSVYGHTDVIAALVP